LARGFKELDRPKAFKRRGKRPNTDSTGSIVVGEEKCTPRPRGSLLIDGPERNLLHNVGSRRTAARRRIFERKMEVKNDLHSWA